MKPVFVPFNTPGGYYIYDGNRNAIIKIEEDDYQALTEAKKGGDFDNGIVKKYQEKGFLMPSTLKNINHPETGVLEFHIKNCMEKITLQLTQECNMRCNYCTYSGNYENRGHNRKKMTLDTAKKGIDFLLEHSRDRQTVNIGFYGGEPLLEKALLKECVEYAESRFAQKKLTFTITTNGTLLDDEIVEYFIAHDFSVMISLDGPREIHDRNRKMANGKGSFDRIMENVKRVQEKYPEFFTKISFNVVLNPENDFQCITDFFSARDVLNSEHVTMNSLADNYAKNLPEYDEKYFSDSAYEQFKLYLWLLKKISKKNVSKLFIQDFSRIKQSYDFLVPIATLPETCHPAGPCLPGVKRPLITVDGKILPCERVNEESEVMALGDVDQGISLEKAKKILNVGQISANECKTCWCFLHCRMCGAAADDNHCFSKEKKLRNCVNVKLAVLEKMKNICFLMEHGFDLEHDFPVENAEAVVV
jgi:uncharacterized protein